MTEDQWYLQPSLRQDLEEILKNPVLLTALQIVRDRGVRSTSMPSQPVDLVQFFALMGAKRDGYIEALQNLVDLTKSKPADKLMPKPWDTPAEAKKAP